MQRNGNANVVFLMIEIVLMSIKGILAETVLERLENLALLTENTNISMEEFWSMNGSFNDPNNDKRLQPYYAIIPDGNFRSDVIDSWHQDPPTEIAVMLFNNIGDLLFWFLFNVENADMSMQTWMTNSRLLGTSLKGLNYQSLQSFWNVSGYQYILSSSSSSSIAWFAVSNFSEGNRGYPSFLIPLNDSIPFNIPADVSNIATGVNLLHEETFNNVVEFHVDVSQKNAPTYMTGIQIKSLISSMVKEPYTFQYSKDNCSEGETNKISYRDEQGYVVTFQTGTQETIEPIYVRCIWVILERSIWNIRFSAFGPTVTLNGFITVPVILFRGYWYRDRELSTTSLVQTTADDTGRTVEQTGSSTHTNSAIPTTQTSELLTTDVNLFTEASNNIFSTSSNSKSLSVQSTESTSGDPVTGQMTQIIDVSANTAHNLTTPLSLNISGTSGLVDTCFCTCSKNSSAFIITQEELEEQLDKIKKELTVNKKQLSSYMRSLISVSDNRVSARSMGYFAGIFLGVIMGVIIILDLSSLQRNVNTVFRRSLRQK